MEEYVENERIMVQGEEGDDLFIIAEGHCDLYETNSHGVFTKVRDFSGGQDEGFDFFGLQAFLLGEKRRITARARTTSYILKIKRSDFFPILKQNKEAIFHLANLLQERKKENLSTFKSLEDAANKQKISVTAILIRKIEEIFSIRD